MHVDRLEGIRRTRWEETARRRAALSRALVHDDNPAHTALQPGHLARLMIPMIPVNRTNTGFALLGERCQQVGVWEFNDLPVGHKYARKGCAASRRAAARVSSSANVSSLMDGRPPKRYKPLGRSMAPRIARRRRRSWLRVTAGPTARPMANATCGGQTLGSSTNEHHMASLRTRTPSRRRRVNESRSQTRRIKSGGKACAALVTAGLQHSPSGAGAHAGAESMLTVPATVVWLKCALHDVLFRTFRVTSRGKHVPWWTLPVD